MLNNKLIALFLLGTPVFSTSIYAEDNVLEKRENEFIKDIPGNWTVYLPKDVEKVIYKGIPDTDKANGKGGQGMLYPAPNAAGFLAAVITHGIISQSAVAHEKNQLQEKADKVLEPYQPVINNFSYKQLMEDGLKKVSFAGNKQLFAFQERSKDWTINSVPIFYMTANQSAIIIENMIEIYPPNASKPQFSYTTKIISPSYGNGSPSEYWLANEGERLKQVSINVFTDSLNIAMQAATGKLNAENVSYKTFRYYEGDIERMERGQLISEDCRSITIKNLSGWIMSFPKKINQNGDLAPDNCKSVITAN
jgi:hypothetical protein